MTFGVSIRYRTSANRPPLRLRVPRTPPCFRIGALTVKAWPVKDDPPAETVGPVHPRACTLHCPHGRAGLFGDDARRTLPEWGWQTIPSSQVTGLLWTFPERITRIWERITSTNGQMTFRLLR